MRLDLNLQTAFPDWRWAEPPLRFTWDSDAGTVTGPDAGRVLERVRQYAGKLEGTPHRMQPESWRVRDPLHNPVDMAALLGYDWLLPPELEAHYPAIADATPAGALN